MEPLDLDRLRGARLVRDPFEFVVVPGFVRAEALEPLIAAFPVIAEPGSFPIESLRVAPAFDDFVRALRAPATTAAFGALFGIDLAPYPTMVTVRGRCRADDGRIHADSATKIVTALIYLNETWRAPGGRLRLLGNDRDLDAVAAEVVPERGTLVAFRRTERSFHGHAPYEGERRVVQLNWVRDSRVVARELARHRLSAGLKRLRRAVGAGRS